MKNTRIEWKKPIVKSTSFEEIAEFIRAKAESTGGTACSTSCGTEPSCEGCGACSCAAECSALALHWSCNDLFIVVGR